MRQTLILSAFLLLTVCACSDHVPDIDDPHQPVVYGEAISPKIFLERYCTKAPGNGTCMDVRLAMMQDAGKAETSKKR